MTRVLSGVALIAIAIAVVWFAPPLVFLAVVEILLVLGCYEYVTLTRASGLDVPSVATGAAAMLTCAAFAQTAVGTGPGVPLDVVLMTALVALGGLALVGWKGGRDAIGNAAASLFACLYLGLPLGAMTAVRETRGRDVLFLLMLTVMVAKPIGHTVARHRDGMTIVDGKTQPRRTRDGIEFATLARVGRPGGI